MHLTPPPPPSLFHLEKISNHFVSFHLFQVISVNIGQKLNVGQNAIYLNLILYLIFPFFFSISPLDFSLSLSLSLICLFLSFLFYSYLSFSSLSPSLFLGQNKLYMLSSFFFPPPLPSHLHLLS